jgi:hypothetical protein
MNFDEESTKVKLWLSIGFMKNLSDRNTGDYKNVFKQEFTFAGMQQKIHLGMISKEVEVELDKKTKEIYNCINLIEECIGEPVEEVNDSNSEDEMEKALLKEYRGINI